jgi:membrane-bound serine protease (ClpP class)
MLELGFALALLVAVLLVAEAHAPGGVLGATGAVGLIAGGVLVVLAAGASTAVAVGLAIGLGLAGAGWVVLAAGSAARARHARVRSGAEGLAGQVGVVRSWADPGGQVYVDGALWRARRSWAEEDGEALHEGDRVVVEDVRGLTLSVRRAEEWELTA